MAKMGFLREFARRRGIHAWFTPPRGADLFADLRNDIPALEVRTVFDVGANVGQSVKTYLSEFPGATIHSFEPVPSTFEILQARFGKHPNVKLYQSAFGSSAGTAMMRVNNGTSDGFKIDEAGTVSVPVSRLDEFGVGRIEFLKVDTEGHDLEVMKGGSRMLANGQISVVQTEVGMHPNNNMHVRLEEMKAAMESWGMKLFALVEQSPVYFPVPEPAMFRCDAVFISDDLIKRSRMRVAGE